MAGRRGSRLQQGAGAPPQWADVGGLLHMPLKDAAAELNVPITYLRRLCRQNGFPHWPGKKIRYSMNSTGKNVMLEVDVRDGSPWARLAGPSQLVAKIGAETKKEDDDDMTRIHAPVANHPPAGEELTTLNLTDKVGSSSSSECS